MTTPPILLVPGFWLSAWAWDEVAATLRADGHDVTALTLPGLESANADRSSISLSDHVDAICEAVEAAGGPVVLAVHSGTGFSGYVASDRVPERIAAMVYVDTAPGIPPLDPDFEGGEKPMSWEELSAEENLDGLSEEQLETFRQRAVPEPGGVLRDAIELTNDARLDIPSTLICTGYSSQEYKEAMGEGYAWLAGLKEVRNVTWVDLPTSHWPMWSRPKELAEIIGDVAKAHATAASGGLVMADVALRETIDADLDTLFQFQADPEASVMAAFPSRDLPAFLERQARIKADPSAIALTIVADAGVVGSIGSWEVEGERAVGFWIGRHHWGNGYATAALRAFLDVDLHRPLHAHVVDHNVGSRRVLEKCGFILGRSVQEEDVLEHVLVLTD